MVGARFRKQRDNRDVSEGIKKQAALVISCAALAVSILSLVSSAVNTSLNIATKEESRRVQLSQRCRMDADSQIEIADAVFPIGGFDLFQRDPQSPKTWIDFSRYLKAINVSMQCMLSNEGSRPVSVGKFRPIYYFGSHDPTWMASLGFLPMNRISAEYNAPAFVPHLIKPGDEALYSLNISWPLTDRAFATFNALCSNALNSGAKLGDLISCLAVNKLALSDNPGWTDFRGFAGVEIVIAVGHGDLLQVSGPYRLNELEFTSTSGL